MSTYGSLRNGENSKISIKNGKYLKNTVCMTCNNILRSWAPEAYGMERFESIVNNIQQLTVAERSSVVDVAGVWLWYPLCWEKSPVSERHNNVDMITNHNYSTNHPFFYSYNVINIISRTHWTYNMTTVVKYFGKLNNPLLKLLLWDVGFTERYFPMDYNTTKSFQARILSLWCSLC